MNIKSFIKVLASKLNIFRRRGLSTQEQLKKVWPFVQDYRGVLIDQYNMEPEDALDVIVEALSEQIPDLEADDIMDMFDDMDADMYESAELSRMKDLAGLK